MRVIVVVVDGLSTQWVGAYGNEWVPTPTLDRLAADGLTFDRFTLARPGVGSFVSGRYFDPPDACETLAFPALAQAGVLVQELTSLEPADLDRLGRTLQASDDWLLLVQVENLLPPWQPSEEALAQVFGSPSANQLEPILGQPPASIDPADDDARERLLTSFAAVVLDTDAYLGHLLDQLAERGLLTPTWDGAQIVVTSSGGFALGERGRVGVGGVFSESVVVPLIVRLDQRQQAGRRPQQLTQSVDLLPTLAEWFAVSLPPEMPGGPEGYGVQGVSLAGICRGESASVPLRDYAVSHDPEQPELTAAILTDSERLLLLPGQAEPLYFLKPQDRYEVNDLHQHHLARADVLADLLRRFVASARQPGAWTPPPLPAPDPQSEPPAAGEPPAS